MVVLRLLSGVGRVGRPAGRRAFEMICRKTRSAGEKSARVVAGLGLATCALAALAGGLLGCGLAVSGGGFALTRVFGWCLICSIAERSLPGSDKG